MGKPFHAELTQLTVTKHVALTTDISTLASTVQATAGLPVYCVGSGGSFTVATIAADLFLEIGAPMSRAITPLELTTLNGRISPCAVWCFSSSGKNPDILAATRFAVHSDSRLIATVCATQMSSLFSLAQELPQIRHWDFSLPSGRDGFLATNSLVAMAIVLMRACGVVLKESTSGLRKESDSGRSLFLGRLPNSVGLETKSTLVVIYSPELKAIALDLESKLVEAGLMNCQIADYRSFAHGRHHWLAKHDHESSVLILASDKDITMARVISRNLPRDLVQQLIHFPGNRNDAILLGLEFVMDLVAKVGDFKGVDPGRPGVPTFGRRIFNLRSINRTGRFKDDSRFSLNVWTERKATANDLVLSQNSDSKYWARYCNQFMDKLSSARIKAIVLDYDGTLCDPVGRYGDLDARIKSELSRLLKYGAVLGIATGRGKSVTKALRDSTPEGKWGDVVVGYYNGGIVQSLDKDLLIRHASSTSCLLEHAAQVLSADPFISSESAIEVREHQLTIVLRQSNASLSVWRRVSELLTISGAISRGIRVVVSSHSVDVLDKGVSKLSLIREICSAGANQFSLESILCIGDKGKWPGNDFELLSGPLALSVDEVSPSPDTGWNLGQPGMRGMQSCLLYLRCIAPSKEQYGELHFDIDKLRVGAE